MLFLYFSHFIHLFTLKLSLQILLLPHALALLHRLWGLWLCRPRRDLSDHGALDLPAAALPPRGGVACHLSNYRAGAVSLLLNISYK